MTDRSTCTHERCVKVCPNAYPVPGYWICEDCNATIPDVEMILMKIAKLEAKLDKLHAFIDPRILPSYDPLSDRLPKSLTDPSGSPP